MYPVIPNREAAVFSGGDTQQTGIGRIIFLLCKILLQCIRVETASKQRHLLCGATAQPGTMRNGGSNAEPLPHHWGVWWQARAALQPELGYTGMFRFWLVKRIFCQRHQEKLNLSNLDKAVVSFFCCCCFKRSGWSTLQKWTREPRADGSLKSICVASLRVQWESKNPSSFLASHFLFYVEIKDSREN